MQLLFICISGYSANHHKWSQPLRIQFQCTPRCLYMSGVQPYLGALLDIWSGNSCKICALFMCCLALSRLYSEMLMGLLHCSLNLIRVHTSLVPLLCRILYQSHLGVRTLNLGKWSTLSCLRYPIIRSKHPMGATQPNHPGDDSRTPGYLLQTGIHSFSLAICLWVKSCRHSLINPQSTAHLLPKGWRKLLASI